MSAERGSPVRPAASGALAAALMVAACVAIPAGSRPVAASGSTEGKARAVLARMNSAAAQTSYEGLRFVSATDPAGGRAC